MPEIKTEAGRIALTPWTLERETPFKRIGCDPDKLCSQIMADGWEVGYFVPAEWDGHSPAARLISAAPDLLEACKALMRHMEPPALPGDARTLTGYALDYRAAKSAIAKAEGR